ncbi:MAG: GNAT family N-acetyltransferase [Planctomycetes bacterium]|nr:GNAT family N-acetyltransferase [Planctomycetota bacterium]
MNIRKAVPSDVQQVADLWVNFIKIHSDLDAHYEPAERARETYVRWLERCIVNPRTLLIVAELENDILGYGLSMIEDYAQVFKRKQYGLISDIAVREDKRSSGIGGKIAERMISWFRNEGIKEVHLFVLEKNTGAEAFWRRMGFQTFVRQMVMDL